MPDPPVLREVFADAIARNWDPTTAHAAVLERGEREGAELPILTPWTAKTRAAQTTA